MANNGRFETIKTVSALLPKADINHGRLPTETIYIPCVVPAEVSCRRASTTAKTIQVSNTPTVLSRCTLPRPIESTRHRGPYDYQKGGSQFPSIRRVGLLRLVVSLGHI
ncbi:MAG TPA: hypothetical protein EYQ26_02590 [Rhodospirillales bacterium]|nr:hypothetical protein [Rhodospirillales bacterium]HIL75286.1 hypothetical protein [Rhodospirillales bacterium]